jgi:signal transduction histidine kinase
MRPGSDSHEPNGGSSATPVDALHVCAELLSEIETATPQGSFYSRLCEATCRLSSMDRAVIFMYDDVLRRVEPAGAHNVDLEQFEDEDMSLEPAPMAQRALANDRVEEVSGDFERELPARYVSELRGGTLSCTPLSAGGRWFGVMFGEHAEPLDDARRQVLWMIGKVVALAASARMATQTQEYERELTARFALAREIHDRVVQRLFGVALVLASDHQLGKHARARCHLEVEAALAELRDALRSPLSSPPPRVAGTLRDEIERLRRRHDDLALQLVEGEEVDLPAHVEPLAQAVLDEAVRNARRHAKPSRIDVSLARRDGTLVLEIVNDGVAGETTAARGMGLRLASLEAVQQGGMVEFGEREPGEWGVRLVLPTEAGR